MTLILLNESARSRSLNCFLLSSAPNMLWSGWVEGESGNAHSLNSYRNALVVGGCFNLSLWGSELQFNEFNTSDATPTV